MKKPWPFLYSVAPDGGLIRNDGVPREPTRTTDETPHLTLREELVARGIRSSSPVPKRIKREVTR